MLYLFDPECDGEPPRYPSRGIHLQPDQSAPNSWIRSGYCCLVWAILPRSARREVLYRTEGKTGRRLPVAVETDGILLPAPHDPLRLEEGWGKVWGQRGLVFECVVGSLSDEPFRGRGQRGMVSAELEVPDHRTQGPGTQDLRSREDETRAPVRQA